MHQTEAEQAPLQSKNEMAQSGHGKPPHWNGSARLGCWRSMAIDCSRETRPIVPAGRGVEQGQGSLNAAVVAAKAVIDGEVACHGRILSLPVFARRFGAWEVNKCEHLSASAARLRHQPGKFPEADRSSDRSHYRLACVPPPFLSCKLPLKEAAAQTPSRRGR